jgi:hypothetical protein
MKFKTVPIFFLITIAFCMIAGAAYAEDGYFANFRRCFCLQPGFFDGVTWSASDDILKICLNRINGVDIVTGEIFIDPKEGDRYPSLISGTWKIFNWNTVIQFTFNRAIDTPENQDNVVNSGTIILFPWWFNGDTDGYIEGVSTSAERGSDPAIFGIGPISADVRRIPCSE